MNKVSIKNSNIFTNSGIRNKVNQGLVNPKDMQNIGHAIGALLAQEFDEPCNILIATDTRTSSQSIKDALIKGIIYFGHDVFDAGIAPTPFVAKAIKDYTLEDEEDQQDFDEEDEDEENDEKMFALGIVVTASHNPAEYNGIKVLTEFGYLNTEMEEEISNLFHEILQDPTTLDDFADDEKGTIVDFDITSFYETQVVNQLENAPYKNLKVVLDCAHGATAKIAERIFKACGITTIAINNSLDGSLINKDSGCGKPELLHEAIKQHQADWGCAFDGDGDRVIIASNLGKTFDGDDILAIIAQHQNYQNDKVFVATIMSNGVLDNYFTTQGKKLIRTPVGERNVIDALIANQAYLGAETCGHITMMDHAFCSDGIFASLMFFDTLASGKNVNLQPYTKLSQVHETLPLSVKIELKTINAIIAKVALSPQEGRIIIRPSNTEPILRIMIEHKDLAEAKMILETVKNECKKELNAN
ncbi:MAG: hypothetical protein NTZ68_01575 [Candidatus Dependentiae bacterium]|nr:hypothetical protein [Candidatus Dependentiae bacterium]